MSSDTAAPGAAPVLKRSFPPIVGARPRALVLGSLPGEESLRRQEYYAHPRNAFWPIVYALLAAAAPPADYGERTAFVAARGIALWDVVAAGARTASADASIRAAEPNPIAALLAAHPTIATVAFNGATACRLHDRHFARRPDIVYLALPSTSPAHARRSLAEKLALWRPLSDRLALG